MEKKYRKYFVVKHKLTCSTREVRDTGFDWKFGILIKRVRPVAFRWLWRENARADLREYKMTMPLKNGWKYALVRESEKKGTFKFC